MQDSYSLNQLAKEVGVWRNAFKNWLDLRHIEPDLPNKRFSATLAREILDMRAQWQAERDKKVHGDQPTNSDNQNAAQVSPSTENDVEVAAPQTTATADCADNLLPAAPQKTTQGDVDTADTDEGTPTAPTTNLQDICPESSPTAQVEDTPDETQESPVKNSFQGTEPTQDSDGVTNNDPTAPETETASQNTKAASHGDPETNLGDTNPGTAGKKITPNDTAGKEEALNQSELDSTTPQAECHVQNDWDTAFSGLLGTEGLSTGADLFNMVEDVLNVKANELGCHPDQLRAEQSPPQKPADNRNRGAAFVQQFENMPQELLSQPRWIPVREDKKPKIEGWQKPENQGLYRDVRGTAGFDICARGRGVEYLLIDLDHVTDENGKIIYLDAEVWLDEFLQTVENIYCERSRGGDGFHLLVAPTAGKFQKITNAEKNVIFFDKARGAKMELFYLNESRYCLMTGNLYHCDKNAVIPHGEAADEIIQRILNYLRRHQTPPPAAVQPQQGGTPKRDVSDNLCEDTPEYKANRIQQMLDKIDPAALSDDDWLAVQSACKNEGVPYSIVDTFNRRDPDRYNETENLARWDSITDPNFDIETLHGLAKRFGYSEHDTWHEWHDPRTPNRNSGQRTQHSELNLSGETYHTQDKIAQIRDACEWRGTKDKDGSFKRISIKPTQSNLDLIFRQDPNLSGLFGYDQFQGVITFLKRAPWHDTDRTGEQWTDSDSAQLRVYIRRNYADLEHKQRVEDSMVSHSHANGFNAVKEFLESLPKWDGTPRAETLFIKFLHAEDSDYSRAVTMNFLFGAIARVYHSGCDFQTCLVLQGAQRIGKSKLIKMLGGKENVNPKGQNWHVALKDSVDDAHAVDALQKGWLIEIEEFSAARKAEINALKSFISANEDTRRFSYDKYATTRPRHCVFCVTCNDSQFLRDPTGNARFVVLKCSQKKFDRVPGMTPEYIRQVWAETLAKYRELFTNGFNEAKLILPLAIQKQAETIAEGFTQDDGLTGEIKGYLDKKIPAQVLWLLLSRDERRNFFVNGHIRLFTAFDELKSRRKVQGGRKTAIDADLEALQDICAGKLGNTRRAGGDETFFYGSEYRNHICAAEIFTECFGADKRKSMHRINEILSTLEGWHLGQRIQKLDPEYGDMKKVYYRNEDNKPVEETDTEQSTDEFLGAGEPINPDGIPPFNPDDIPFD